MRFFIRFLGVVFFFSSLLGIAPGVSAQTGNSSTVQGTVTDPSGAVVSGVVVTMHNPVSGFERSATTDASGNFSFSNVPFNPYHLSINVTGFAGFAQDVDVRSSVPVELKIALQLAGSASTVTVESGSDLLENDSSFHTDVDRELFEKLPLESASSSVSSLVTLATPGVAADSNGLFHGLGRSRRKFIFGGRPADHRPAEQSFLQPDSHGLDSVAGSDFRRASGGVWRQDQPGD